MNKGNATRAACGPTISSVVICKYGRCLPIFLLTCRATSLTWVEAFNPSGPVVVSLGGQFVSGPAFAVTKIPAARTAGCTSCS
jgi:hypothetical protein